MNFDARMSRTENRPLPSKRISKAVAGSFILIAFISGVLLLFLFGGLIPATIGLITFIWYNFLYTPLKRLTSSALFVGAFVGAFPPLIGWTAAGGNLLDVKILSLCLMIFIWQVPHFMLLLLYHGSEYQKAGFKVLSNYLSPFQLRFLIRIWIYATSFSVLPLWFSGIIITPLIFIIVIILAAILSFTITSIISKPEINYRKAFMLINAYLIIQLLLIIVDHLN